MNIPKCPNCGSTAQVLLVDVYKKFTNTDGHFYQKELYRCGCGCAFQLTMSGPVKVEVITDEY